MRILQILNDDERGGVQTLAETIQVGLEPHGFDFETAYVFPRPGLSTLSKLACAWALARRNMRGDFDVLLAYQPAASILVGIVGWLQGCRLRVVHQTSVPGATAFAVRLVDRLVGSIGLYTVNIANSASTWAEFARYPARYRAAMRLIEHGIDPPTPTRSRDDTRRRFSLPPDRPVLLNVGRLVAQKNQEILVRMLALVPDAHLVVAGGGENAEAYRALAASLGVVDRLHLLGAVGASDIADLYAAADLFVFPSAWETFGLAAIEAAMAGLPMVVADLAVLREVLSTSAPQPVTFVDGSDVNGWASAIRTALATPDDRGFARTIALKYSRQRMIDQYVRLLRPEGAAAQWAGLPEKVSA